MTSLTYRLYIDGTWRDSESDAFLTVRAEDRAGLIEFVKSELGGLDVLINNAGICSYGHFASGTEEILRRIMEVNFFAPAELIRACFPLLKEGKLAAVVNVASMCGRRGMPSTRSSGSWLTRSLS